MSFKTRREALLAGWLLGVATASGGCRAEVSAQAKHAELGQPLEDTCADAPPDVVGDVLAILSSIEPLDPAEPQAYGSAACGGVVFEFENPDEEPLHGAWVQASGPSQEDSHILSERRCPERTLQADYWGYKDREWTKLATANEAGTFVAEEEQGAGSCNLEALLLHEGEFEKLRVVARVAQGSETYPMHALVW